MLPPPPAPSLQQLSPGRSGAGTPSSATFPLGVQRGSGALLAVRRSQNRGICSSSTRYPWLQEIPGKQRGLRMAWSRWALPEGSHPLRSPREELPIPFRFFFLPRKSGAAATLRGSTRCRSFLCPHRSIRSAEERNVPGVPPCAALTASEPQRAGARSGQSGSGSVGDTVPLREQLSPLKSPLEALRPKLGEQQHWVGGIARTSSPLGTRFVPCGPPSDCDRRARG